MDLCSLTLLVTFSHSFSRCLLPSGRVWPSRSENSVMEWGPPGSPETETTLLPVRLPGSYPGVQTAHFEMIRVLYSLKPHPRMRTSTYFYPESNKRSPTSDDPVTCPLGSSHGLICFSAQLQGRSLEAPPLGYAQCTCC